MAAPRNRTIDVIRLTAAFFIICLHNFSGSGVWAAEEIVALARFAVPVFFLFSGYFAAGATLRRKGRRIGRVFLLAVFSNLAYLALDLSRQPSRFQMRFRLWDLFTPESWKNFLLFNESPVSGHLWFLGALLYCLLLDLAFSPLFRRLAHRRGVLWGLSGGLLLGGLVLYHICTGNPAIDFPLCYYRNFLFLGLPFFLSGKLIGEGGGFAKTSLPKPVYGALALVFSGCALGELRLLGVWELYFGSAAVAFLLLHYALCYPAQGKVGWLMAGVGWLGRHTALAVYIVHIYFLDLVRGWYWENMEWRYEVGVYHWIPVGVFLASVGVGTVLALGKKGVRTAWRKARSHGERN